MVGFYSVGFKTTTERRTTTTTTTNGKGSPKMQMTIKGQIYERGLDRPHVTRDGRTVMLAGLKSRCATCGAPFECLALEHNLARGEVSRRCRIHKRPGSRVNSNFGAKFFKSET